MLTINVFNRMVYCFSISADTFDVSRNAKNYFVSRMRKPEQRKLASINKCY